MGGVEGRRQPGHHWVCIFDVRRSSVQSFRCSALPWGPAAIYSSKCGSRGPEDFENYLVLNKGQNDFEHFKPNLPATPETQEILCPEMAIWGANKTATSVPPEAQAPPSGPFGPQCHGHIFNVCLRKIQLKLRLGSASCWFGCRCRC